MNWISDQEKQNKVFTHIRNLGLTGGVYGFAMYLANQEAATTIGKNIVSLGAFTLFITFLILFFANICQVKLYLFPEDEEVKENIGTLSKIFILWFYLVISTLVVSAVANIPINF